MNVLVFKVSRESVVMADIRQRFVSFTTIDETGFVDLARGTAKIQDHHWPIQKFSECWCDPMQYGMPKELVGEGRIDTYIAVDPELEKFLSIKHENEKSELKDTISKMDSYIGALNCSLKSEQERAWELSSYLDELKDAPWYKRVFIALKNDYIS